MATKPNKAGQQQPYVPAGNGDASGEYADNEYGSNVHYSSPEREREKTPESVEKQPSESVESETTSGDIDVNSLVKEGGEIKISRGSLTESQQKIFNDALDGFYKEFPDMPKFDIITVDKRPSSNLGGRIRIARDYSKGFRNPTKTYELYINSGFINEQNVKNQEYVTKYALRRANEELETAKLNPQDVEKIERLKRRLEDIEKNKRYSNVAFKLNDEHERLKSLINHELMHREIVYKFGNSMSQSFSFQMTPEQVKLNDLIYDTFVKAMKNGDAERISEYAETDADEFISEAYSQVMSGIETPDYIKNMIKSIKEFKK